MKTLKTLILIMLLLVLTVSVCPPASAEGVRIWQGAENATPAIYAGDTPVLMETLRVMFDIPTGEFQEANEEYSATVTAEYQLYTLTAGEGELYFEPEEIFEPPEATAVEEEEEITQKKTLRPLLLGVGVLFMASAVAFFVVFFQKNKSAKL